MPTFRSISNPYMTPLGAHLVITGMAQFNAASNQIQTQFAAIGRAAIAAQSRIAVMNTSLVQSSAHIRSLAVSNAILTRSILSSAAAVRALAAANAAAARASATVATARAAPVIAPPGRTPPVAVAPPSRRPPTPRGGSVLGGIGSIEPGGQARAFFGQRAGPLSIYTRLPVTLNATAVAAAAAGVAITAMGAQLQRTGRQIQVFGGTTEEQMTNITDAAVKMSREFTAGAGDIAKGALQLSKAGAPIQDLNNNILRSVTVLNQASQGEVDVTNASDTLVQGITALNLKWQESTEFVGGLIAAVQGSTASFTDFTLQLKQTLPVAGLLGIKYDELFATLALLNQAGLRGSIAGTALKNALIAIADPTSEAAEILRKYNISLFDAEGNTLPLIEIVGRLGDAFGKVNVDITDAQRFFETADIFNTRQILAALSLITQGTDKYEHFLNVVRDGKKTGEEVAKSLQNNLIDQLRLVFNNVVAASHAMTAEFLPSLTKMASALRESLSEENLLGFRGFGREINLLITSNNNFANSLIEDVLASANVAREGVQKLINTIMGVSGAEITWQTVGEAILSASHEVRNAVIVVGVALEILAEEINKQNELLPVYREELEKTAQSTEEWLQTVQVGLQPAVSAIEAYLQYAKDRWTDYGAAVLLVLNGVERGTRTHREVNAEILAAIAALVDTVLMPAFEGVPERFNKVFQGVVSHVSAHAQTIVGIVQWLVNEVAISLNNLFTMIEQATGVSIPRIATQVAAGVQTDIAAARKSIEEGAAQIGNAVANAVTETISVPFEEGMREAATRVDSAVDSFEERVRKRTEDALAAQRASTEARRRAGLPPMPSSMGFWDDVLQTNRRPAPPVARPGPGAGATFPPTKDGGAGGGAGGLSKLEQIAARIRAMLADIPAVTEDLVDFLANIAEEFPNRLQPMVAAIRGSRGIIDELVAGKRDLLAIDLQLIASEQRLASLQAESSRLDIQQSLVSIGYEKQLLGLRHELMAIDNQMAPIQDRITDIQREINRLQRENYSRTRDRLNLEIQMLPIRRQIAEIDRQIADVQKRNFEQERQRVDSELAALPLRRQIRDIEHDITDLVDRRAEIQREITSLDIADVEDELSKAWEKLDVQTILALESRKTALEESLKSDEKAERQARRNALELEKQKVDIEEMLKPIERRLELITDTEEETRLLNERTIIGFEEQRAALEELLKPIERRLQAIDDEIEAENLRNALLISHLEEERQRLEDLLEPLEDRRRAINRTMQEIELLRATATLEFEERKIALNEMMLLEQLRQAELKVTRDEQERVFTSLVLGFAQVLTESGAFTTGEALEVAERMRLWDDQIAKLAETIVEFERLDRAADGVAKSIKEIERDITVTITTVHKDVYETSGAPPSNNGAPQFAKGGVIPGRRGAPMLVLAHGGERITSVLSAGVPDYVKAREAASRPNTTIINNYDTNYNMSPRYTQYESPASIGADLRALIMMTNT